MERLTTGTGREVRHGGQLHARAKGSAILCLLFCITVVAAGLGLIGGSAPATVGATALLQEESTPGGPGAVETQQVPQALQTGDVPLPVETGGVGPVASGVPANGGTGSVAGTTQTGGGFPWWILLIPVILGLLLAALAISRRRQATVVATAAPAVAPSQRAYTGTTTSTTTTTTSTSTGVSSGITPAAAPDQVVCPNCNTANSLAENFCHECGQDLRAARAQMLAAPVDVVDEYTPYLETQSRVDEQLEYVLSRAKVTIGTASGNDIVIDSAFSGSASVAGVHAELRRDGEGFVILDRGSENGVFVNGARVAEQVLNDNDELLIGEVRFLYRAPARPQG